MEVWKIIFLSKWVICRFHVNLPGCTLFWILCLVTFLKTTFWEVRGWKTRNFVPFGAQSNLGASIFQAVYHRWLERLEADGQTPKNLDFLLDLHRKPLTHHPPQKKLRNNLHKGNIHFFGEKLFLFKHSKHLSANAPWFLLKTSKAGGSQMAVTCSSFKLRSLVPTAVSPLKSSIFDFWNTKMLQQIPGCSVTSWWFQPIWIVSKGRGKNRKHFKPPSRI